MFLRPSQFRRYPKLKIDTATANSASAKPKNADSGSRRTDQENSETPQGKFQYVFEPCARAIPEAANSSRAPNSASPKARKRASLGRRIEARLAAAPARYAINPALK